jgi:predicted nucleotidyltransferase
VHDRQQIVNGIKMNELYQYIVNKAIQDFNPKKIFLFGSRARGDFTSTSDLDLAFELDANSNPEKWAYFCVELDESAPSLLNFDLVNFNEASEALKRNILKEGKVLFKR